MKRAAAVDTSFALDALQILKSSSEARYMLHSQYFKIRNVEYTPKNTSSKALPACFDCYARGGGT